NGDRFRTFITEYYDAKYHPYTDKLWELRNSMVHSFSPRNFVLTHHNSLNHFKPDPQGVLMLNAEDVYAALVAATEKYFAHLRSEKAVQDLLPTRLGDPAGGGRAVGVP